MIFKKCGPGLNALAMVLAIFALITATTEAAAETVILQQDLDGYTGTRDATLFEDYPDHSAGAYPYVFAGVNRTNHPRRTLIRFDLTAVVPATATITTASLQLYTESGRPGNCPATLHRMTHAWNEGNNQLLPADLETVGQGKLAQAGDSTWGYVAYDTTPWTTAGGDFNAAPSAAGIAGIANTWLTLTGDGLVQDLQEWLTTPVDNHGWAVRVDESTPYNAKRYYSSESPAGTELLRPRLTIEFDNTSQVSDGTLY